MKYFDELKKSMEWLGEKKSTYFIGQAVEVPGTAMFNTLKDLDPNITKRIFKVSRADQPAKLKFIDNEIQNHSSSKIYFFHQELRLAEKMLENHSNEKNFTSFSFKYSCE